MDLLDIRKVAKKINLKEEDLELYGKYKAKISDDFIKSVENNVDGKLVLVTAITPTKAGEGKTTASISLAEGLSRIKQKCILCLREPSMGPVFGLKGGATGGGKVTIEPSMDINLHFNGDMHALTSSINLIAACIDNHIYQGNELNIDPDKILWKRVLDCNDRELREVEIGLGNKVNGIRRTEHFEITVASELMAILCLAKDKEDFKERVNKILIAYTFDNKPVYLESLKITNAILMLMNEALKPNLVQTGEGNPCLIHGGPFANIAHGCSSIIATKLALKLAPITITEAGFGADLGAEKFYDIKCRVGNLHPDCTVLVATIRALKMHGGQDLENLNEENIEALKIGLNNLDQHYQNLRKFGVPVVVAINHFESDTLNEIKVLEEHCKDFNYSYAFLDGFIKGSEGCVDLANKVVEALETKRSTFNYLYPLNISIEDKIKIICKEIYRAKDVVFLDKASEKLNLIKELGLNNVPICMAKTPLSFSDDANLKNTPRDFIITVKDIKISAGAGFIVPLCGSILTMPGLPKTPAATKF